MANIAVAEACPIDINVFAKSDHFKKFAHFVRHQQFVQGGGRLNIGGRVVGDVGRNQFGDAQIQ